MEPNRTQVGLDFIAHDVSMPVKNLLDSYRAFCQEKGVAWGVGLSVWIADLLEAGETASSIRQCLPAVQRFLVRAAHLDTAAAAAVVRDATHYLDEHKAQHGST